MSVRAGAGWWRRRRAPTGPAVEFVFVVESGPLEAQTVLAVRSLRRFGGRHAHAAVTTVSPRPARRPSATTVLTLQQLGATHLERDVDGVCPVYPTSWRTHVLAEIEARPGPPVLVQMDGDTVFLGDIGPLCADGRPAARAVDVKGMGSTGPGDHYEPYWEALCALAGVAVDDLPWVRATVDGSHVRATHNGGFVAAPRALGLFARAEALFVASVREDLRPHRGLGIDVVAGAGAVGTAGSEWWGSAQAVVSVAAAALGTGIGPLPDGVNVPVHLWHQLQHAPTDVLHAHYHWLLDADRVAAPDNPMLDGRAPMSAEAAAWIARQAPLRAPGAA